MKDLAAVDRTIEASESGIPAKKKPNTVLGQVSSYFSQFRKSVLVSILVLLAAVALTTWKRTVKPRVIPHHPSEKNLGQHSSVVGDLQDNWGVPNPEHKISFANATFLRTLTRSCDWGYQKFSEKFEGATLHWYKSTSDWEKYKGYDLVPELHDGSHTHPMHNDLLDTTTYGSPIKAGNCEATDDEGGTWVVQRIGPFKSYGSYDWWQFGWDNMFFLREVLKEHPDGVFITNHFSGGVDTEGNTLGFPPIHIHHVHASPGNKGQYRMDLLHCLFVDDESCDHPFWTVFEQHGDYQCSDEEGGTDCLLENLPHGYAKLVTSPMVMNGELNDVRAPNSPELEWWYQTAIRYEPKQTPPQYKALSLHYVWSPGRYDINDQSTMVNTFMAPTDHDTVIWYTGQMPYSGNLIRGKMHTHNTIFKDAFLFSATETQLGMDGPGWIPKNKVYDVQDPQDMGFGSIDEVKAHIMRNYLQNIGKPDKNGLAPRLICAGNTSHVDVEFPSGTFSFDRRGPMGCDEWSFDEGEPFIVVGFNTHAGGPPGPHLPDRIPEYYPGHLHWFLSTETADAKSHYTYGFYSQDRSMAYTSELGKREMVLGGAVNFFAFVLDGGQPRGYMWNLAFSIVLLTAEIAALAAGTFFFFTVFAAASAVKRCKQD